MEYFLKAHPALPERPEFVDDWSTPRMPSEIDSPARRLHLACAYIVALEERLVRLLKEASCPCCREGVNLEGEVCSECKGTGSVMLAYETGRVHDKLREENFETPADGATTSRKSAEIIRAILELCNKPQEGIEKDWTIAFAPDWGGFSLTVLMPERGHTHCGPTHEDGGFEDLIEDLHRLIIRGSGLSFVR